MAPSKDAESSSSSWGLNSYKMAPSKAGDSSSSSWLSNHSFPSNICVSRGSPPFKLDKLLLAKRSAKIASLLDDNPYEDISTVLRDIQADPETLELIARFCHGFEVAITSDNIIPLLCTSHQLQMTDDHSPNNLLSRALDFFRHQIIPSWDQTIRALRPLVGPAFKQAAEFGLLDHCSEALSNHALSNPSLLAQPIYNDDIDPPRPSNGYRPSTSTRRKLFGPDHHQSSTPPLSPPFLEDLTSLPLHVYEPVIEAMTGRRVPPEHVAGSLYRYLKRHAFQNPVANGQPSYTKTDHYPSCPRQVIEVVERLIPPDPTTTSHHHHLHHLFPLTLLLEMYAHAVSSRAGPGCLAGLEARIGKQLDRATPKDLLALDLDVESLRRILQGYFGNFTGPDPSGLVAVADLMEEYLAEAAEENPEMDTATFAEVAQMVSSTTCVGPGRASDGLYRAVDVYLEKHHRELTEAEREEVCRVLDFNRMSPEACDHAAMNQRLPLRVVVQALFASQLQLRNNVTKAVGQNCSSNNGDIVEVFEDEEDEDDERSICDERKCRNKNKKKKVSLWKEVKRKFGCMGGNGSNNGYEALGADCNCQLKKRRKVHPK